MANYIVSDTEMTATAEAVRQKGGTAELIPWKAGTGFADAVEAIETGGGGDEQGLIDLTINYADADGRTWNGTIEDNKIKNFSTSNTYSNVPLFFKKPIAISTNDVISMTLEVSAGTVEWANFFMLPAVYYMPVANESSIPIAQNFLVNIGTTTKTLTYTGDPVVIVGIGVCARSHGISSLTATPHLDINNVRVF